MLRKLGNLFKVTLLMVELKFEPRQSNSRADVHNHCVILPHTNVVLLGIEKIKNYMDR